MSGKPEDAHVDAVSSNAADGDEKSTDSSDELSQPTRLACTALFGNARAQQYHPKWRRYYEDLIRVRLGDKRAEKVLANDDILKRSECELAHSRARSKEERQEFLTVFVALHASEAKSLLKNKLTGGVMAASLYRLVRWGALALEGVLALDDSKTELREFPSLDVLMKTLLGLLEKLMSVSQKYRLYCVRRFVMILEKEQDLASVFMKMVKSSPAKYFGAIDILLHYHAVAEASKKDASLRKTFMSWLDELIVSSKTSPSVFAVRSFDSLVKTLSHDEFSKQVLPAIVRMTKRSPGATGRTLSLMLDEDHADRASKWTLDTSRYVDDLLPFALSELRHSDEKRREYASSVVAALGNHSSDTAKVSQILTGVVDLLLGKKGIIGAWAERVSLLTTLTELCAMSGVKKAEAQKAAEKVVEGLLTYLQKESHDETREVAFKVLATWCERCAAAPKAALQALVKGLDGAGANSQVVPAVANTLLSLSLSSNETMKSIDALARAKLRQLVADAKKKPNVKRATGLPALALLVHTTAELHKDDEKSWAPHVCEEKGFVNHAQFTSVSQAPEGVSHARLFEAVGTRYLKKILSEPKSFKRFFANYGLALVHPYSEARSQAVSSLFTVLKSLDDSSKNQALVQSLLIEPFFDLLMERSATLSPLLFGRMLGDTSKLQSHLVVPSQAYANALDAIAKQFSEKNFAKIMYAAHHPLAQRATRKRLPQAKKSKRDAEEAKASPRSLSAASPVSTWGRISGRWHEQQASFSLEEQYPKVKELIFSSTHGLSHTSGDIALPQTACAVLTEIAASAPRVFMDEFVEPLLEVLSAEEMLKLTSDDLAVYFTPEGEPSPVFLREQASKRPEKVDKNKKRGKNAMYEEDEEWEQKEDAKKRKAAAEKALKEALETESAQRKHVESLAGPVRAALEAFSSISRRSPKFVHDELVRDVLPRVHTLLSSSLVRREAFSALLAITRCLGPQVRKIATQASRAVLQVVTSDPKKAKAAAAPAAAASGESKESEGDKPSPEKDNDAVRLRYEVLNSLKNSVGIDLRTIDARHLAANRAGPSVGAVATAGGRGRGRGLAGRGVPAGGRGRGRGVAGVQGSAAPVPGALGRGRGRGRGRGSLNVGNLEKSPSPAVAGAPQAGRGRGRGRGSALERKTNGEASSGVGATAAAADVAIAKPENFLTTASFVFILPLLKFAVANGVPKTGPLTAPPIHSGGSGGVSDLAAHAGAALSVVARHCNPAINVANPKFRFPAAEVTQLILNVLATYPNYRAQAEYSLLRLAPALADGSELAPLLGPSGVLHPAVHVRLISLKALLAVPTLLPPHSARLEGRVWIARHDAEEEVVGQAMILWRRYQFELHEGTMGELMAIIGSKDERVRKAVGRSIASFLEKYPDTLQKTIDYLIKAFKDTPDKIVKKKGFQMGSKLVSRANIRCGLIYTLGACVERYNAKQITEVFKFFVKFGLADNNELVFNEVLQSGLAMIRARGAEFGGQISPIFEGVLSSGKKDAKSDKIREGAVIYVGTLSRNLLDDPSGANGEKLLKIVKSLIDALSTPSYDVQSAVSECIGPLMAHEAVADAAGKWIETLLKRLTDGKTFGHRKGAAFGLAGMVKGLGIKSLKQHQIMDKLAKAMENTASMKAREGALFAYTQFFDTIGTKFEPYVVHVLPHITIAFGDNHKEVRMATREAARTIMANLTGHGIKMVLPQVLNALNDNKWRAKLESIYMLGAMAWCAPKQLAQCLPQVVPRLTQVLADPHSKVQAAGEKALRDIGSVIKTPEIASQSKQLLAAICHPDADTTKAALQALIDTSFINSVDAPSLALIVPILMRGLNTRQGTTKRMSAQIIGSVCSFMDDVKSIEPYYDELIEGVKAILVDPLPEVRAAAAHAIGRLQHGIGPDNYDPLANWLMDLLKSETTKVQRSGAAQGLAELVAAYGNEKLEDTFPSVLENVRHTNPLVREGYLQLLVFLPRATQDDFVDYIEPAAQCIFTGLADEKETVRSVGLHAGKVVVFMFGRTHSSLLLTILEDGLFDANAHVRESSVTLIGDLLHGLSSADQSSSAENTAMMGIASAYDDITEETQKAIFSNLGDVRRDSILSALYLCRADTVPAVRTTAWHIWKSVVVNTPKTLRVILPTLTDTIIRSLSSPSAERQACARRATSELIKNTGDSLLSLIIPILQEGLQSDDPSIRTGVVFGLSEVMASARKTHITEFMIELVPAIRQALCDESSEVRHAAGEAFIMLSRNIGPKSVDEIIPPMVAELNRIEEESERNAKDAAEEEGEGDEEDAYTAQSMQVIEGIREVLNASNSTLLVLSHLIPRLIQEPISVFRMNALASLAPKFGRDLSRHIVPIMKKVIAAITGVLGSEQLTAEEKAADDGTLPSDETSQKIRDCASQFVLVIDQGCVHSLVTVLTETVQSRTSTTRARVACATLLGEFCGGTKDFEAHVPLVLQALLQLFGDKSEAAQKAGWTALKALTKAISVENLATHITFVRSVLGNLVMHKELDLIPGFCLKKGIEPVFPMFQYGLMHGSSDNREQAASGLGEIVQYTSPEALRPYVIKITGPLIRVVGDRFPAEVKAAILKTLGLLLEKTGKFLRPFLPQLQTSFVKALHDESKLVRERAASSLAVLMELSPRVDALVTELNSSIKGKPDADIRTSMFSALAKVLQEVGKKVSPHVLSNACQTAVELRDDEVESVRVSASKTLGVLIGYLPADEVSDVLKTHILVEDDEWRARHASTLVLTSLVDSSLERLASDEQKSAYVDEILAFAMKRLEDENDTTRLAAPELAASILIKVSSDNPSSPHINALLTILASAGADSASAIRQAVFNGLAKFGEECPDVAKANLKTVMGVVITALSDSNIASRTAANKSIYALLQMKDSANVFNEFVKTLDDATRQFVSSYCRKLRYI